MSKQLLAIANCRVSSDDQLKNNSLTRQKEAILRAAESLGVAIPNDGWWSGSVSSKSGQNIFRKDIKEMLRYCETHRGVKFLIIDEPDRFMRSIDEAMYFEMQFKLAGVKVYYASDKDLNNEDMTAKLMKFMKYFVAEGSNEERQRKSVSGHVSALRDGRWPFQPPAGYKKGYISSIPEIDQDRGEVLREALLSIVEYRATPTEALSTLNKSIFVKNRAKYKMDKFRKICTDPFYAGVVEMDKQVKFRNENGRHQALITIDQYNKIVDIFASKKKSQSGPRKNGNPDYPLSNIVHCKGCKDTSNGRYVGFKVNNGVNKERVYHKYRCRSCKKYFTREILHQNVSRFISEYQLTEYGRTHLISVLGEVWQQRKKQANQDKVNLGRNITALKSTIDKRVDAAIDPNNALIKSDLLTRIEEEKHMLRDLERQYESFELNDTAEKERFIEFALEHAENMERHFLKLPKARLLKCKQMLFPAGFWIDHNKKVYTPEMSILTRLASTKKDLPNFEKSFMVRVRRL